jgi:hypothetical protein
VNKTNTIMMSRDDSSKGHILVVGHVTRDIFEDRQQLGGAATYAARASSAFGCRISLVIEGRMALRSFVQREVIKA